MQLTKRQSTIGLLALLSALSLIPMELGRLDALAGKISDAGHLFFYALLGFYFARSLKPPIAVGFLLMLSAGLLELIQPHLGRDGTFEDFVVSGVGAFYGLWLRVRRQVLAQAILGVALSVLVMIPIYLRMQVIREQERNFPDFIVSDERALRTLFQPNRSGGHDSAEISFGGGTVLVKPVVGAAWPGIVYYNYQLPWTGYEALEIVVKSAQRQYLHVRIDDHQKCRDFGDRYNASFPLNEGDTLIRIPLSEIENGPIGRKLELNRIRNIYLFLNLTKLKADDFQLISMRLIP
jgi:VanZ family protein